jgi:hypothetical protein
VLAKEEEELSRRFARYADEELDRILTAGGGEHSRDERTTAAWELSRRQPPAAASGATAATPAGPHGPHAPAAAHAQRPQRPRSPYLFIDLLVDALLCGFTAWAVAKLASWTATPRPWGELIFYVLVAALVPSVLSLRRSWRAREWRD